MGFRHKAVLSSLSIEPDINIQGFYFNFRDKIQILQRENIETAVRNA